MFFSPLNGKFNKTVIEKRLLLTMSTVLLKFAAFKRSLINQKQKRVIFSVASVGYSQQWLHSAIVHVNLPALGVSF